MILILQQNGLRWYGHVLQKDDTGWVKKYTEYEMESSRPRARQRVHGKRLCKKSVKHVNLTGTTLWIVVDERS